jgi:RNA polymerase sigma factor (sigma-70 family)
MDVDTLSGHILERFKVSRAPELFATFYELNVRWLSDHLYRSARRFPAGLDPGELAADVFYDIYRSVDTFAFRSGPAFRRWVYVLAHNRIRKGLRSMRSRPLPLCTSGLEMDDRGAGDPFSVMVRRENAARMLACWFLLLVVCQAAICSISPPEREILRLHVLDGETYRALAERLRVPLAEVTARGRRSRRKVARYMKRYFRRFQVIVAGEDPG